MNTYNPYAPNPYILQGNQPQEIGGLSPVFQNIAAQQAAQNAALAQQNQLVQQAGQTGQQGGMNPAMMAQMLRKNDPNKPAPVTDYSQPMPNYMDSAYQQAGY
jgi:hypothetical protein